MRIFIDQSAWVSLINSSDPSHKMVTEQFHMLLGEEYRLFTSNIIVGQAVSELRDLLGTPVAFKFFEILEEAHLGNYLRVLWIGRRTQKEALRLMRRFPELPLSVYDFANSILMERRRIHTILSLKTAYKELGLKVLPEKEGK